jgi:hypothetical protein
MKKKFIYFLLFSLIISYKIYSMMETINIEMPNIKNNNKTTFNRKNKKQNKKYNKNSVKKSKNSKNNSKQNRKKKFLNKNNFTKNKKSSIKNQQQIPSSFLTTNQSLIANIPIVTKPQKEPFILTRQDLTNYTNKLQIINNDINEAIKKFHQNQKKFLNIFDEMIESSSFEKIDFTFEKANFIKNLLEKQEIKEKKIEQSLKNSFTISYERKFQILLKIIEILKSFINKNLKEKNIGINSTLDFLGIPAREKNQIIDDISKKINDYNQSEDIIDMKKNFNDLFISKIDILTNNGNSFFNNILSNGELSYEILYNHILDYIIMFYYTLFIQKTLHEELSNNLLNLIIENIKIEKTDNKKKFINRILNPLNFLKNKIVENFTDPIEKINQNFSVQISNVFYITKTIINIQKLIKTYLFYFYFILNNKFFNIQNLYDHLSKISSEITQNNLNKELQKQIDDISLFSKSNESPFPIILSKNEYTLKSIFRKYYIILKSNQNNENNQKKTWYSQEIMNRGVNLLIYNISNNNNKVNTQSKLEDFSFENFLNNVWRDKAFFDSKEKNVIVLNLNNINKTDKLKSFSNENLKNAAIKFYFLINSNSSNNNTLKNVQILQNNPFIIDKRISREMPILYDKITNISLDANKLSLLMNDKYILNNNNFQNLNLKSNAIEEISNQLFQFSYAITAIDYILKENYKINNEKDGDEKEAIKYLQKALNDLTEKSNLLYLMLQFISEIPESSNFIKKISELLGINEN